MRLACVIATLASLTLAVQARAQNPFGDVTNEPRPDEFHHWSAEALDDIREDLEGEIASGTRTLGHRFVFERVLATSEDRAHDISIVHREGYTQPEIHEYKWDIYVILDGSGSLLMGGERVGWVDGAPPEEQRPTLRGAQAFEVGEGDILSVPAKSWHQIVLEPGQQMTYALINVTRNEWVPVQR